MPAKARTRLRVNLSQLRLAEHLLASAGVVQLAFGASDTKVRSREDAVLDRLLQELVQGLDTLLAELRLLLLRHVVVVRGVWVGVRTRKLMVPGAGKDVDISGQASCIVTGCKVRSPRVGYQFPSARTPIGRTSPAAIRQRAPQTSAPSLCRRGPPQPLWTHVSSAVL